MLLGVASAGALPGLGRECFEGQGVDFTTHTGPERAVHFLVLLHQRAASEGRRHHFAGKMFAIAGVVGNLGQCAGNRLFDESFDFCGLKHAASVSARLIRRAGRRWFAAIQGRAMLDLLRAVYGLGTVLLWAAFVSFPILPTIVIPRGRRERFAMFGARMFAWLCVHVTCFAKTTVVGRENLPTQGGYLVVSNHRSWLDVGLLILYTLSQGISKKEIAYVPFFGLNGYLSGVIFFNRAHKLERGRVVEEALFLMGKGNNLHVFPEGTRTRDGKLREKVSLRLVQECGERGIPVIPACVWGTENAVPATGYRFLLRQSVGLELAAPLNPKEFASSKEFAAATWDRVREMADRRGANGTANIGPTA